MARSTSGYGQIEFVIKIVYIKQTFELGRKGTAVFSLGRGTGAYRLLALEVYNREGFSVPERDGGGGCSHEDCLAGACHPWGS